MPGATTCPSRTSRAAGSPTWEPSATCRCDDDRRPGRDAPGRPGLSTAIGETRRRDICRWRCSIRRCAIWPSARVPARQQDRPHNSRLSVAPFSNSGAALTGPTTVNGAQGETIVKAALAVAAHRMASVRMAAAKPPLTAASITVARRRDVSGSNVTPTSGVASATATRRQQAVRLSQEAGQRETDWIVGATTSLVLTNNARRPPHQTFEQRRKLRYHRPVAKPDPSRRSAHDPSDRSSRNHRAGRLGHSKPHRPPHRGVVVDPRPVNPSGWKTHPADRHQHGYHRATNTRG